MTKAEWIHVAKVLMTSRLMDSIEENELAPKGKVLYQFSARGHELGQIILAQYLNHAHDAATVYYRSRPFVLAAGMTIEEGFAGPLAKQGSRNGGRDIGVVHNLVPRNGPTVLPASGDVGAQFTPAVGWAQAIVYRSSVMQEKDWHKAVAVALGGDASCATNGFWAALTIATTKNYPMIFFIEDNNYGISVPGEFQTPGANIAANLASFNNLLVLDGDGTDPETADALIKRAVQHTRARLSPVLLRLTVPRICGHSGADNQSYKSQETLTADQERDPLNRLQEYMFSKKILSKNAWTELEAEVENTVRQELAKALSQPEPEVETIRKYAFSEEGEPQLVGGMAAERVTIASGIDDEVVGKRMNLIAGVNATLAHELQQNNRLLVFGEDVGVKGGVHGATVGLQSQFGNERVFDTSLSEEGIIGRAVGMAYAGLVPVAEIQFRKYLDPAMEQINDCGTIRWRTNNQFAAPIIVRIPIGHSKRTGDPWHSVSGEAIFTHTIGWRIAIPSNISDAVGLMRTALRGNDPTFFLEHRNILDTSVSRGNFPSYSHQIPFGLANTVKKGDRITVVTWGEMVYRVLDAAKGFDNSVEIIDLRTVAPWDKETVLNSVKKTNRCLIAHEDTITNGFGAEIAATITKEAFSYLDAPITRVATPDIPIPYNLRQMDVVVPTVETLIQQISQTLSY
ncbi:MAG: pyruvate dehydrogenase [Ignavibacteria bacterium]|nr:pyruvate dehydrogenase [Ignavibacteria bacterium]